MPSMHFNCNSIPNNAICLTTVLVNNCSKITGNCEHCALGWTHSTLFIAANDCMQPIQFPIIMLIITSIICTICFLASLIWAYNSYHLKEEKYIVGGYLHVLWSKFFLTSLNCMLQLTSISVGIACMVLIPPQSVGILWCLCGILQITIMYGTKQRMVHPALVLHHDAGKRRRHIERRDFYAFILGTGIIFLALLICAVSAYLNVDSMYNWGIFIFLISIEFFQLVSLLELMWMSKQVKKLGLKVLGSHDNKHHHSHHHQHHHHHSSSHSQIGGRYARDGNSKEYISSTAANNTETIEVREGPDPFGSSDSGGIVVVPSSPTTGTNGTTASGGSPSNYHYGNTNNSPRKKIIMEEVFTTPIPGGVDDVEEEEEEYTLHMSNNTDKEGEDNNNNNTTVLPPWTITVTIDGIHTSQVSVNDLPTSKHQKSFIQNVIHESSGGAHYSSEHQEYYTTKRNKLDIAMARVKSIGRASSILFICFQPLIILTIILPIVGTLPFASIFGAFHIWLSSIMMTFLTYRVCGSSQVQYFPNSKYSSRNSKRPINSKLSGEGSC
jgi:hypothetical protein